MKNEKCIGKIPNVKAPDWGPFDRIRETVIGKQFKELGSLTAFTQEVISSDSWSAFLSENSNKGYNMSDLEEFYKVVQIEYKKAKKEK